MQAPKNLPETGSSTQNQLLPDPSLPVMAKSAQMQNCTDLNDGSTTPLMAQYFSIKSQHPDCLVFFRLGDFYELFFQDAEKASTTLDIALTRRGQHQGQDIPMCGVPAHSYEGYLEKLIRNGYHVAICEQTEDPATAKKRGYKSIVNREVVRIITPGTLTEDTLLDARAANYIACLTVHADEFGLAWLDLAAGTPYSLSLKQKDIAAELARLAPSEILCSENIGNSNNLAEILKPWQVALSPQPNSRFNAENAKLRLQKIYNVMDFSAFGTFTEVEITALGALLDYIELTQKCMPAHLRPPKSAQINAHMAIDSATRRNLEIMRTLQGERNGSLLAAIDLTITGAGARLLQSHLAAPLTTVPAILARQAALAHFLAKPKQTEEIRANLKQTPDIERALARLSLQRGGPRDLAALRDSLLQATKIKSLLIKDDFSLYPNEVTQCMERLIDLSPLVEKLLEALSQDLPLLTREGGFIAKGYAPHLDEILELKDDSRRHIAALQQKYISVSGASNLKIKHNNILGYYIETPPGQADRLLNQNSLFIHRQSLSTCIRFTTVELGELEKKITEAADRSIAIELQIFDQLCNEVLEQSTNFRQIATSLARLDVMTALATLAATHNYCCPKIDESLSLNIQKGRHPVVERALAAQGTRAKFVANDCTLSAEERIWLLTGPNMAGKSTFLRQNALIVLMAQIGSYVPAQSAHIGIVDRLYSRVGAADDLARGQSTFMVEMIETAAILNLAEKKSFVILDEIGRGTSTYDGLSIATATMEWLHNTIKCRCLFATHYHEMTSLQNTLPELRCATVRIKEWNNEIIFLHEVVAGVADKSYGIHVARMAGLPAAVVKRAEDILTQLEKNSAPQKMLSTELPLFSQNQNVHVQSISTIQDKAKKLQYEQPTNEISPQIDDHQNHSVLSIGTTQPAPQHSNQSNFQQVVKNEQSNTLQHNLQILENILNELEPDSLTPREAQTILYKIKELHNSALKKP